MAGEILIGVIGVTGSGKSSFIKRLTKSGDIVVSSGLSSTTIKVASYPYTAPDGTRFLLVDTPGLDDTERVDSDILQILARWLKDEHTAGMKFRGLLYLHRIIDNRAKGTDLKNLRMFKSLCGSENFSHVAVGTTFWDKEDYATAVTRERLLTEKDNCWGDLVKGGASVFRMSYDGSKDLEVLMTLAKHEEIVLRLQKELAIGTAVEETETFAQIGSAAQIRAIMDEEKQSIDLKTELHQKALNEKARDLKFTSENAKQKHLRDMREKQRLYEEEVEKKKKELDNVEAKLQAQLAANLVDEQRQKVELEETRESLKTERVSLWKALLTTGAILGVAGAALLRSRDRD